MSDQPQYQCHYKCGWCGRRWIALDVVKKNQKCACDFLVAPHTVSSYNLSQVRHWEFWDQVEAYKDGSGS